MYTGVMPDVLREYVAVGADRLPGLQPFAKINNVSSYWVGGGGLLHDKPNRTSGQVSCLFMHDGQSVCIK